MNSDFTSFPNSENNNTKICKKCGTYNEENAKHCSNCNAKLDTASNVAVILWLIFFFPVGLYLMWKKTNWKNPVRIVISAYFALCTFFWILVISFGVSSGGGDSVSPVSDSVVSYIQEDESSTESSAEQVSKTTEISTEELTTVETTTEVLTESTTVTTTKSATTSKQTTKSTTTSNVTTKANSNTGTTKNQTTTKQTTTKATTKAPASTTKSTNNSATVYWVASGDCYHSTKDCPTLKRSKNIQSGAIPSDRKPCKVCY